MPDFNIIALDGGAVKQGSNIGFSILAQPLDGIIGEVAFSVSGGPAGMVATWPWGNIWKLNQSNPHTNLQLNLDIPLGTPPGVYPVTVTGVSP